MKKGQQGTISFFFLLLLLMLSAQILGHFNKMGQLEKEYSSNRRLPREEV